MEVTIEGNSALWHLDGEVPLVLWFYSLRDLNAKLKIEARLNRIQQGNLLYSRSVGEVNTKKPTPTTRLSL